MWQLDYSREASNYAIDSHPYNEDVLIEIELLAQTATGLPSTNCMPAFLPEHYFWQVAGHRFIFGACSRPPASTSSPSDP